MPYTSCPYCGRVQGVDKKLLGQVVGCMNHRCEFSFTAREFLPHRGGWSLLVFGLVIASAVFLMVVWGSRNWYWLNRYLTI